MTGEEGDNLTRYHHAVCLNKYAGLEDLSCKQIVLLSLQENDQG